MRESMAHKPTVNKPCYGCVLVPPSEPEKSFTKNCHMFGLKLQYIKTQIEEMYKEKAILAANFVWWDH